MKKFALLLCVGMVALCVPQKLAATSVNLNNGVLTINTTEAGTLSTYAFTSDHKTCTEIVLSGKFNSADLNAISYASGFQGVTKVDMSEAQFVTVPTGTYSHYSEEPSSGTEGQLIVVGGDHYVSSVGSTTYTWEPTDETTATSSGNLETPTTWSERERSSQEPVTNKYYEIMVAHYYVKYSNWEERTDAVTTIDLANAYEKKDNLDSNPNNGTKQKVRVGYKYYHLVGQPEIWVEVQSDPGSGYDPNEDVDDKFKDTRINYYKDNNYTYARFPVYSYHEYVKCWNPIDVNSIPNTVVYSPWPEAERNNHLNDAIKYIGFPTSYNYYYVSSTTNYTWGTQVSYVDGQQLDFIFSTGETMTTPTSEGRHAAQGGIVKIYNGSSWEVPENKPDYSQMKFSYWSETLTTAVTSKYADTSISNKVFDGCTKLTSVDYMAGNVTGFGDHKISEGYNTTDNSTLSGDGLSVKIYKDVTQIDDAAFERCDVLTSVTFVNDYVLDENHTQTGYPKELTIGNSAFEGCANLSGIVIPNRVTSIGNSAFKTAGNRGVTDGQAEADDYVPSTEFKVTFERRNHLDADGEHPVAIDCDFPLTIGNSAFEQCYNIKNLSLPIRLESMGASAFKNTKGLASLVMRETTKSPYTPTGDHHLLKTIPSEAFQGSHVTAITVPMSVTLIENAAFGATNHLASITFQMQKDKDGNELATQETLVIKEGAFAGGKESISPKLHVYVEIDPSKRKIICEYNAFNFTQMMQQTDVANEHGATLHFDDAYWDYYQGNWKKGLAFLQTSLNSFKDGYTDEDRKCRGIYKGSKDAISLSTGKYEYTELNSGAVDGQYAPANGWQQFAGTDTGIEIVVPSGNFIRTFSETVPTYIPTFIQGGTGGTKTYFYKIYRVSYFDDGFNPSTDDKDDRATANSRVRIATATEVTNDILTDVNGLTNRRYIPANTGLIMVGQGESGQYIVYNDEVVTSDQTSANGYTEYQYDQVVNTSDNTGTTTSNLLYPTCAATGHSIVNDGASVCLYPTMPYPIGDTSSPSVQDTKYRNFGFTASERKFYRCKPGTTGPRDLAYLKLPLSLFHWSDETGGTGESGAGGDPTSNLVSSSRISLLFEGEDNTELTDIELPVATRNNNDSYYTLKGVKVSHPQGSGLYIFRGKIVFVK